MQSTQKTEKVVSDWLWRHTDNWDLLSSFSHQIFCHPFSLFSFVFLFDNVSLDDYSDKMLKKLIVSALENLIFLSACSFTSKLEQSFYFLIVYSAYFSLNKSNKITVQMLKNNWKTFPQILGRTKNFNTSFSNVFVLSK